MKSLAKAWNGLSSTWKTILALTVFFFIARTLKH